MKNINGLISLLIVLVLVATCATTTAGQQITGGIAGTVSDMSGARVPGATVTAVNTATNLAATTESSKEGSYQIANLPIGVYTLTIKMAGFKTESHTSILVE